MTVATHLGVYGLFLVLATGYTWPLVTAPARLLPPNGDPRLFSWVLLTIFENLTSRPPLLFHGNAFYPFGNTLDPAGRFLGGETSDTFAEPDAAGRLARWIDTLPEGAIVAGAVKDEASGRLAETAIRALQRVGVQGDIRGASATPTRSWG